MIHQRIVLDTNVIISAIISGGAPRQVMDLVIRGSFDCYLSYDILEEIRDVLIRPKFGYSEAQCMLIYEELHAVCNIISPAVKISFIKTDPDDNRILECAVSSRSKYIITGDQHLLAIKQFQNILIISPADFLHNFTPA